MDKIFISIAAYRDPLLVRTLKQAYEKADNPDSLIFALGMQYEPEIYPDLSFIPRDQLRIINYHIPTRPGVARIRYEIAKSSYINEKYFLMIDSHMIFQDGWDTWLINSLNGLGDKSVITGLGEIHDGIINLQTCRVIDGQKDLVFQRNEYHMPVSDEKFIKTNYITCGFMFTYGDFLNEVGLDEYSHFDAEEPYLSWRTFMSGWDIYHTTEWVINHSPENYYDDAWGGFESRKFVRDDLEQVNRKFLILQKGLAYVYNDYSYYSIKNSPRKPIDWFLSCGHTESDYAKISEYFDKIIHNNLTERDILIL